MRNFIFFLTAATLSYSALAADVIKKDPKELLCSQISMLDDLITMTERSLNGEKQIKTLIIDYQKIQEQYLKNQNDKDLVVKMVRMAHRILIAIQENHLTQQFDPDFISELTLFSKIAAKKGIPKP